MAELKLNESRRIDREAVKKLDRIDQGVLKVADPYSPKILKHYLGKKPSRNDIAMYGSAIKNLKGKYASVKKDKFDNWTREKTIPEGQIGKNIADTAINDNSKQTEDVRKRRQQLIAYGTNTSIDPEKKRSTTDIVKKQVENKLRELKPKKAENKKVVDKLTNKELKKLKQPTVKQSVFTESLNISDYKLYQLLEANGYNPSKENLYVLKEGLINGDIELLDESK